MEDESFKARVNRLFGSKLFEAVPKSGFPDSSWSVTDGEVEKREWNRERGDDPDREDTPCSSAFFEGCFSKKHKSSNDRRREFEGNLGDLDDEDEEVEEVEEEGGGEERGDDREREEREIRSSIGLDSTLDNEDEEDEFDKAALCRETAGERVYMRDVKDHGPYLNYHAIVPDLLEDSIHHFDRDPRADHIAASVRLEEDKEVGGGRCPSLQSDVEKPGSDLQVKLTEDDANLKPILKRKETQTDFKPKKRVRFDPGCKDGHDEVFEESRDFMMVPQTRETITVAESDLTLSEKSRGVPDYIQNPSKYIRYTFDMSDKLDDESNMQAFEDFRNLVKTSNSIQLQPEITMDLPKSIAFTPRKKANDAMAVDDKSVVNQEDSCRDSIAIAAGEVDACAMEEDDMETSVAEKSAGSRKARKYRSKLCSDDSA